jgi:hypothetical protein
MAKNDRYEPPKQSMFGQVFDSLFLLLLTFLSLFAPLWLGLAGGGKTELTFNDATWAGMNQTPVMQAAWEKLGYTAETAKPLIASRFDYVFDPIMLAITAVVIIGYFVFVVRYSDKEYRDVIRERFGDK